jgi:hypothetical protein
MNKEGKMTITALTYVILSVAAYRITRFMLFDSLIGHSRQRWYVWLGNHSMDYQGWGSKRFLAHKLLELTSCSWCLGVWVSAAIFWLFTWTNPIYWGRFGYITVAAIAGFQGMIHAVEPDEE